MKTYSAILGRLAAWNCEPAAVLLYIDLRNLRGINRIAEAEEGDALIERVGATLNAWAGRNGLAGRLWSNEFIAVKVIDHTQGSIDEAMDLRDRLAQLRYRSPLGESEISVAIGVNTVRRGVDWARAIAEAGEACEASKRRGLNQIVVHSSHAPKPRATANAGLVIEFRRLLAAGQLALHPQPIMDVRGETPRLAKAEFLLRQDKNGVHMPIPAGTIETLETFGLATELDRFASNWILDWLSDNYPTIAKLDSVSINLSARSIVDGRFMDLLLRDVKSAHLPPGKLCFEITETAAIEHLDVAAEVIAAFHASGVGFSLDDFGSGLCSFGYLQQLQVDEVKIDGRFIRDVATGGAAQAIVRAIHQVAHATGKRTVAEFVDDPRKLAALREIGVDYAQGWLFYPTVTPEKFGELLNG